MKNVCLFLLLCAFSTGAMADYLQVYDATGPSLSLTAQANVGAGIQMMTKETGDMTGTGQQSVALYDGTDLRAYTINGGVLENYASRVSEAPEHLATGGDMNEDGLDEIIWVSSTASNTCRSYTVVPVEEGSEVLKLSVSAWRSNMVGPIQIGMGQVYENSQSLQAPGDEFNGYDTWASGTFVGLYETNDGRFTAPIYDIKDIGDIHENANLIDMQHINVASRGDGLENFMVSFYVDGLAVWHGGGKCQYWDPSINLKAGQADEAMFLQVGNVHAYSDEGSEEIVLYRKDGSIVAYSVEDSATYSAQAIGNIGIGVTDMLVGDLFGDGLEELVVAKGDLIEVYSLASGNPLLISSGTVTGLVDMSIGDLDGNGLGDIIVGSTVPEPATMSLLLVGGLCALIRRKN